MRISDWSSDVCSSDLTWFHKLDRARNIQDGRELLERELKRLGLQQADPAPALQKFNAATLEDLQVMVALGDVGPHQVARALLEHERAANEPAATEGPELAVRAPRRKAQAPTSAFTVVGLGHPLDIGRPSGRKRVGRSV